MRRLHNKELYGLHRSSNIAKMIEPRKLRWAGHVARMECGNSLKTLTGKPTRKIILGKPRRRWEDSIRTDRIEIVLLGRIGLIRLRQAILDIPCEYGIVPSGFLKHEVS